MLWMLSGHSFLFKVRLIARAMQNRVPGSRRPSRSVVHHGQHNAHDGPAAEWRTALVTCTRCEAVRRFVSAKVSVGRFCIRDSWPRESGVGPLSFILEQRPKEVLRTAGRPSKCSPRQKAAEGEIENDRHRVPACLRLVDPPGEAHIRQRGLRGHR